MIMLDLWQNQHLENKLLNDNVGSMTKSTFEVHTEVFISWKKTNILIFIKSSFWIKCNYGGIDNHYREYKIFYDEVAAFDSNHRRTLNHSLQKIIDEYLLNWINNQLCVFVSYGRLVWYPCNLIIKKNLWKNRTFFLYLSFSLSRKYCKRKQSKSDRDTV